MEGKCGRGNCVFVCVCVREEESMEGEWRRVKCVCMCVCVRKKVWRV